MAHGLSLTLRNIQPRRGMPVRIAPVNGYRRDTKARAKAARCSRRRIVKADQRAKRAG